MTDRQLLTSVRERRDRILELAARRGATNVRIFGSAARGDSDDASDIDFLVEMEDGRSLLDRGGLLMDLKELLGRDVDVVTEAALAEGVKQRVLDEAVPL